MYICINIMIMKMWDMSVPMYLWTLCFEPLSLLRRCWERSNTLSISLTAQTGPALYINA